MMVTTQKKTPEPGQAIKNEEEEDGKSDDEEPEKKPLQQPG